MKWWLINSTGRLRHQTALGAFGPPVAGHAFHWYIVELIDMPPTSEIALNGQLAEILRDKHPLWRTHLGVEQTGVFPDHPRLRPDILVQPPNAQPVVVKTEYVPATTVEGDAKTSLIPLNSADPIEQAIAVRIPDSLRHNHAGFGGTHRRRRKHCHLSTDNDK